MLRLRPAAWAGATAAVLATAVVVVVAEADVGVILSASCAMKVPRPSMTAAKMMMVRMTLQPASVGWRFHHSGQERATNGTRASRHFGENGERSVNAGKKPGSRVLRLEPPSPLRAQQRMR